MELQNEYVSLYDVVMFRSWGFHICIIYPLLCTRGLFSTRLLSVHMLICSICDGIMRSWPASVSILHESEIFQRYSLTTKTLYVAKLWKCSNLSIFLFCIYRNNRINLSPRHLPGVLGPCDSSPEWIPFFISIAFLSSIWLSPPLCAHTNQGSVWLKGVVVLFLTQWQQSKHFIVSKQRRRYWCQKLSLQ